MLSSNVDWSTPSQVAVPSPRVKTVTFGGVSVRFSSASAAVQYLVRSAGNRVTMSAGPLVGSGFGSISGRLPLLPVRSERDVDQWFAVLGEERLAALGAAVEAILERADPIEAGAV